MSEIRLNSAGIAAILASPEVAAMTGSAASAVASSIHETARGGEEVPVLVRSRTAVGSRLSERTAYDVTLAHPAGLGIQATRGTLTRAAAEAGLEVTAREAVS